MGRKLIRQGTSTLMVSLPKKWIDSLHLEKGDEVHFTREGTRLIVSAERKEIKRETRINLIGPTESSVRTQITSAYRAGYDRITVSFETQKQFNHLKHTIRTRLIGFEIVDTSEGSCIVENLTEPSSELFHSLLKKIFFNVQEQCGVLIECISESACTEQDRNKLEEIQERIQKYDNFCRRVIAKGRVENIKSEFLYLFLQLFLHGSRELYHLPKSFDNDHTYSQTMKSFMEEVKTIASLIEQAYIKKDVSLLENVHQKEKELIYDQGYALLQKGGVESTLVYSLMSAVRKFYQSNSPLVAILT